MLKLYKNLKYYYIFFKASAIFKLYHFFNLLLNNSNIGLI